MIEKLTTRYDPSYVKAIENNQCNRCFSKRIFSDSQNVSYCIECFGMGEVNSLMYLKRTKRKVVINPFAVLPVLIMGYGSVGMVVITTLLNLSIVIINIVFCIKKLKMQFSFKEFDVGLMKEMTIFSSFIFVNLVIDQINWNIDKFILGRFHGTVSVAIYGLASQLNTYYISIATTISSVFVPRVHKLVASANDNQALTELFTRIGRIQFIILSLIATGLIFFGQSFINLWAGSNYNESYPIVLLLILPVTISLIQNIGIEIQRAKDMHHFRSWVYFFMALINVGLTLVLAQKYGGVGAAAATGLSMIIANSFIMNWYYHVKIGLDIKYFWKQIFGFAPALILPLLSGMMIHHFVGLYSIINFLLSGIAYVLIFSLSIWFLGMNDYEKKLIGGPLLKFLKKLKFWKA